MKGGAGEVDIGAVTEPANDVRMTDAIKRHRFVLKILYEGMFKVLVRCVLQEHVQRLDDYGLRSVVGGGIVVSNVDLGVAAASETFNDVVTTVEPALL